MTVADLRVALLGAGNIARAHLEALARVDRAEVVGIFDQDQSRARERAEAYRVGRVYASWRDLLEDDAVNCVAVLLPSDVHERYTIEALGAGKHVVCEKPLGHSIGECDRMLATAEKAGRRLFPVHNRVYDWAAERMGEIVRAGQIGEVILAQSNGYEGAETVHVRPWLATPRGGGGVLLAQSVHPAYLLRWILGDVARVSCQFGDLKVVDMTAEDTAVATLKFASGALAELTATFGIAHGPFDHQIMLHGRDGYLELRMSRGNLAQPQTLMAIAPQIFGDKELHQVEVQPSDGWGTGFKRMWEDYTRGILDGAATRMSGDDGKRAVEIILAAYRSSETGQTVDLPLRE